MVVGITPGEAKVNSSVATTISGNYFEGTTQVYLSRSGRQPIYGSFTVLSQTRIGCTFVLTSEDGFWNVNVSNPAGTAILYNGFRAWNRWPPPASTGPWPKWYLAEGSTAWGFGTYLSIVNPNDEEVTVRVTYMTESGALTPEDFSMPPLSQATVSPQDYIGQRDFSTKVECLEGRSICADRTMLWPITSLTWQEMHSSVGVTSPLMEWYLPEGSSAWGFETWLLIANPGPTEASCDVTYMIEDIGPRTFNKKVPPYSRRTFNMASDIGSRDASIKVTADVPVIPERAMYVGGRRGGHESIGTPQPSYDYYLAEGSTSHGFDTFVLIQNPTAQNAVIEITYQTSEGPVQQAAFPMLASSRETIRVSDVPGMQNRDFSTHVHGSAEIIAERAMYWNNGTGIACHDSIGLDAPHKIFYLPDGQTAGNAETYILVQNPNNESVNVQITYLNSGGRRNVTVIDIIPARTRRTYRANEQVFYTRCGAKVVGSRPIMVERSMYWNRKCGGSTTIGGWEDPGG